MDLSTFDRTGKADPVGVLNLLDLDGRPMVDEESGEPVTISLVGTDSKEYVKAQQDNQTRRLNAIRRRGTKITGADVDSDALDIQVACTKEWSHIIWGGKDLECNAENIRMVYARIRFIREQVAEFIEDRANFLGNSHGT